MSLRILVAGVLIVGGVAQAAPPTDQEQLFLYELNRARHAPSSWAAEMGLDEVIGGDGNPVDLLDVAPSPPLALNELLVDSARGHSEEMATRSYFAHVSPFTGIAPNRLLREAGYPLPERLPFRGGVYLLPDDQNQVESIAAGCCSGAFDHTLAINALVNLIVDTDFPSLGHRVHLLAMDDFHALSREAGAGFASDPLERPLVDYWTFHTGHRREDESFLTGVVFDDANGDGLYDAGEGLPGVSVAVDGDVVLTNAAGGWSLGLDPGLYSVRCSGGGFVGTARAALALEEENRAVDCISGRHDAVVDFEPIPSELR